MLPHPSYRRLREIKAAHDPGQAIMSSARTRRSRLVRPASNLVRYEKAHRVAGMRIEWISLSAVPALIADGRIRAACTLAALLLLYHARPG